MVERTRSRNWGRGILIGVLLVLAVAAVAIVLNRDWVYDKYREMTYQPSAEMARIRDALQLTERGEFLFNASQPELDGEAEFNAFCRKGESTNAVLGCYTAETIYVYNIDDEELAGIRELTAAHELLHAVYARTSEEEKKELQPILEQVLAENQAPLANELDNYEEDERFEELYVRAGTEIANLPDSLERHYAEIFRDQDAVVAFYNSYIEVFRTLAAEMDSLKTEMDAINEQVETKIRDYEQRVEQLNASIVSFNSCAEVAGCYETEYEFYLDRAALIEEQEELDGLYEEIGDLINAYNAKVEAYNADVLHSEKLNTIINSTSKPTKIDDGDVLDDENDRR